ncbi:MAG: hypothetical protein M3Y27_28180, partial [Acidobacteriota bacterium]|nr:hypothetical protein [Acidobacteriota bacterium]
MLLCDDSPDRKLVLLIDQFEECFTAGQNDAGRTAFFDNLTYAAGVTSGQVIIMTTLRTDFYGKCASHAPLAAALSEHQELVGSMSENEIRNAIE